MNGSDALTISFTSVELKEILVLRSYCVLDRDILQEH